MKRSRDAWLIRLPSGQELKAKSTKAVLHHVENGVIPRSCLVRRTTDQEWKQLDWTMEFSAALKAHDQAPQTNGHRRDMAPFAGIASRLDPLRLRTVGVRGIWEDLLAALDSTFVSSKLVAAAIIAATFALLLVLMPWLVARAAVVLNQPLNWSPAAIRGATGFFGVLLLGCLNGLLARITYIELSNMRPCRPGEAMRGFFALGFRLVIAYFLIVAVFGLIAALLRSLPAAVAVTVTDWGLSTGLAAAAHTAVAGFGMAIEAMLWFALALTWLLAPIMVVEDCDVFTALGSWCRMLAQHPGRILLAEALAVMVGLLVTLPFAGPVWLALEGREFQPGLGTEAIRFVAWSLVLTPFLAFLAVANVFIYLDVRYEHDR